MSESTIDDEIRKLRGITKAIEQKGVEIMKEEVPVGRTGNLKNSVIAYSYGDKVEVRVSTVQAKYAPYVLNGRGPLVPHRTARSHSTGRFKSGNQRFLKWEEYNGSQSSVHHGGSGTVFARYAGPAPANDFESRSKRRLDAVIGAIWAAL